MKYYNACIYNDKDILTNNNVITVENGEIIAVTKNPSPVIEDGDYDCHGAVVYPTFMDCAVSLPGSEPYKLFGIDLSEVNTMEDYVTLLTSGVAINGIRAFGYNMTVLDTDGAVRLKRLLDRLCPHTAAYIWADDLTSVIVNNYILEEAKRYFTVDKEMCKDGMLDLTESQILQSNTRLFDFTPDEIELSLLSFQNRMLQNGITAVRSIGLHNPLTTLSVLHDMEIKNSLLLDVVVYIQAYPSETLESVITRWSACEVFNSEHITIKGVSVSLDGSIDSGQAALKQTYECDPYWSGTILWNRIQLSTLLRKLTSKGISVNINAIGDAAVEVGIDALIGAKSDAIPKPLRTLTHAYLMDDDSIKLCARNGITVCVEPNSVPYNNTFYDGDQIMIGDRVYSEYPIGRLAFAGVNLIAGSNYPTQTVVSPIGGVYKATHRVSADDVTPYRVLAMFGSTPRELYNLDTEQGLVAPGMLANFVILDKDIVHMREDLLCDVKYLATVVRGVIAWEAE